MVACVAGLTRRAGPKGLPGWVRDALPYVPVTLMAAAYALRFGLLSVQVQDGYGTPGFDMGIFDQGVWLLSRFRAPFVTVMGRDLFGDHTSFILFLVVPLYWLIPRAQTLLVLQALLIAAAVFPIFALCRKLTSSTLVATLIGASYLLNPALQNANLEQFHPEAFEVFLVAVAIYAAVESKRKLLIASVLAYLLVKEDSALMMVPLGVWVAARRDRRLGIGIVAGSVAYMLFATQVVIRLILGTASFYTNRLPFGGVAGFLLSPFTRPIALAKYLVSGHKPFYVWQMGVAFGWVFVLSPEIAAIAVLMLAENVASNFPYMQQIYYHYSLPLVPVLAMGSGYAVSRLAGRARQATGAAVVFLAALISCSLWGLAPFSRHPTYPHLPPNSAQVAALNRLMDEVPPHAVVSAWYGYVPHLDHRTSIYQWPTPFRAQYWGLYTQEGQRLPFASQVRYLVLPLQMSTSDQEVFDSIAGHFRLIHSGGGAGVWIRTAP